MLKPIISEIVYTAASLPTRQEKIAYLRKWDSAPLRLYLRMMTDKTLKWALPKGTPPYKPCHPAGTEMALYVEARRMYIFHEGGNPRLQDNKRQTLFINLLENIHPDDAKFLLEVVVPKVVPDGLSMRLINEAFPGVVNWPSDSKEYDGHTRKDDKKPKDTLRGLI